MQFNTEEWLRKNPTDPEEIRAHISKIKESVSKKEFDGSHDVEDIASAISAGRNLEILPFIKDLKDARGNTVLHLITNTAGYNKELWANKKLALVKNNDGQTPIEYYHEKRKGWPLLIISLVHPECRALIFGAKKRRWPQFDKIIDALIKDPNPENLPIDDFETIKSKWNVTLITKEYFLKYNIAHCIEVALSGKQEPENIFISHNNHKLRPTPKGLFNEENQNLEYVILRDGVILFTSRWNKTNGLSTMSAHLKKMGWEVIQSYTPIEIYADDPTNPSEKDIVKGIAAMVKPAIRDAYQIDRIQTFIQIMKDMSRAMKANQKKILHSVIKLREAEVEYNTLTQGNPGAGQVEQREINKLTELFPEYKNTKT